MSQDMTEVRNRVADGCLFHLAEVGRQAGNLADEVVEDVVSREDMPYDVGKRRSLLRKRLVRQLEYVGAGVADVKQLWAKGGELDAAQGELGQQG